MVALRAMFRVSERFACRVVGQHRSTQRHAGKDADIEEAKLRHRLREIAAEHIRWGRRMAHRILRREGWTVNHKRVHRLWREEGLQRPTPHKQKRARPADGSVRRHQAEHPHQVWAMDFQFDATADGRRLKFLNVIDEHSRLCLAIRVGRRCKAKDVVAVLEELTSLYPAPAFVRSDNGPEFIAHVTQGSTITLNVLVMNLEKLLELLFVLLTVLLRLLLVNEGGRSIHTVPLKPQIAAA